MENEIQHDVSLGEIIYRPVEPTGERGQTVEYPKFEFSKRPGKNPSWRFVLGYSSYSKIPALRIVLGSDRKGLLGFVTENVVPPNWVAIKINRVFPTCVSGRFILSDDPEFTELRQKFYTRSEYELLTIRRLIDPILPEQSEATNGRILVHDYEPLHPYLKQCDDDRLGKLIDAYPPKDDILKAAHNDKKPLLIKWYRFLRRPQTVEEYQFYRKLLMELIPTWTDVWGQLKRHGRF